MRLYGRDGAVRLVYQFSVRDQNMPQPSPVLIVSGHRGSGKSALLDFLQEALDQKVPYARVNFGNRPDWSIPEVLSLIVQDLNKHCAGYGRIAFPRFIVGRIVMSADGIDHDVPARAREQIAALLEEHKKIPVLKQFIADMLGTLQPGVPAPNAAIGLLLRGLINWKLGGRVVLGEGPIWYGHQDRGLQHDCLDVLRDLNRRAQGLIDDQGRLVDDLLLAAFLADLRAHYAARRGGKRRNHNCVILLDDADEQAGANFLDALQAAFRTHADRGSEIGPITVVATSRGPLTEPYATPGEAFPTTDEASVEHYRRRGGWCYPVRLPDLTLDQVHAMAEDRRPERGDTGEIAVAVHRFTRGHVGATAELLDAIVEKPAASTEIRQVLERKRTKKTPEKTVSARLLDLLLGDLPDPLLEQLITCAAARDLDEAGHLVGQGGLIGAEHAEVLTDARIWLPGAAPDVPRMHPVVRRLLLDRLADRPADAANSWTAVHDLLRRRARAASDKTGELYHALALGELEDVVEESALLLRELGAKAWLDLLYQVATAPHRRPFDKAPVDHANAMARRYGYQDQVPGRSPCCSPGCGSRTSRSPAATGAT